MSLWRRCAAAISLAAAVAGCRLPYVPGFTLPPPAAVAHLTDANGRVVGHAVLLQDGGSVRIVIDINGLKPGLKAVHIHGVGRCEPPSFESAGAHFNPGGAEHGSANPRGPHAGDLPSVVIDSVGRGHLEVTATRVTLEKGKASLFDSDGSAIVVHEGPDDMRTDPEGNSGARVACGVILRAE
jgi:Cu-Zn family superoxide dismutase